MARSKFPFQLFSKASSFHAICDHWQHALVASFLREMTNGLCYCVHKMWVEPSFFSVLSSCVFCQKGIYLSCFSAIILFCQTHDYFCSRFLKDLYPYLKHCFPESFCGFTADLLILWKMCGFEAGRAWLRASPRLGLIACQGAPQGTHTAPMSSASSFAMRRAPADSLKYWLSESLVTIR